MTRDADAVFMPHGIVLEVTCKVAEDLVLPSWWLKEQANVYISGKEDASKRRLFDHPGLRVMAASPAHVSAMKARPARTHDIDDLRLLAEIIGLNSAQESLRICAEFIWTNPYLPDGLLCFTIFSADDLLTIPRCTSAARRNTGHTAAAGPAATHPHRPGISRPRDHPQDAMAMTVLADGDESNSCDNDHVPP